MTKQKVVVAMSGGVDSSMAAALLKEAGYDVIGITMHLWDRENLKPGSQHRPCCSTEDINDARQVCYILNMPFYAIDLQKEFTRYVIDYFCQEYNQGRTPNPCIPCNKYIKFGFLLHQAFFLGATYLATGHYARVGYSGNNYHLLKAADIGKDQSYVLYTLGQEQLRHLLFPLGNYSKADIRHLAREKDLPVADKPASQDICFVTDNCQAFLSCHLQPVPGDIIDSQGKVLGQHPGIAFYTIGQRHGLGLALSQPLYVIRIEPETNRIVVGNKEELYSLRLFATRTSWVSGNPPPEPVAITAKIRYKSPEAAATLYPELDSVEVWFHQPQPAITPGQSVVFYQNDEVLGGGIIESCVPATKEIVH